MSKASQMVNAANLAQRKDSSAMHSDEDFSSFSAQALANEEYFNKLLWMQTSSKLITQLKKLDDASFLSAQQGDDDNRNDNEDNVNHIFPTLSLDLRPGIVIIT